MARLSPVLTALSVVLVAAACSGSDTDGMTTGLVVAKTSSSSGDGQSAAPGAPLPSALRVIVTDNGAPQSGETVTWATTSGGGTITPAGSTDASGVSTATWTLGAAPGTQTATATVAGATNSPLTFSATAASGTVPTITATSSLTFSPSTVTINAGGAVRFVWASDAGNHNVVPATGNSASLPASPGSPTLIGPPQDFTVGFPTAGVFNFWCSAHGQNPTPTTVSGMSGTITVQ